MNLELLSPIVKAVIPELFNLLKKIKSTKSKINEKKVVQKLSTHLIEINNWCKSMPFYHLGKESNISNSISLLISSEIRKLSSKRNFSNENNFFKSEDIFTNGSNFIILGAPGAGKSTTIKRMILKLISLDKHGSFHKFPLLIRLRNLKIGETLHTRILDVFGIPYEARIEEIPNQKDPNNPIKIKTEYVENIKVNMFVPELLESINVILFLDGFDEIIPSIKDNIKIEIKDLGLKVNQSNIILTSRTGEYVEVFPNFELLEIQPLSSNQVVEISKNWLNNDFGNFINELKKQPYVKLADRPLFLAFLLIIYYKRSSLPYQPSNVYREITHLILEEWDASRGIERVTKDSNYSAFVPRQKLKFLSNIAFHLTFKVKKTVFTTHQLERIYVQIYNKFNLPIDDIKPVIKEIESHNGIISESFEGTYEFSHLSLQEYLAASYLVTIPITNSDFIYEQPGIIAIACSISENSSEYFAQFFNSTNSILMDDEIALLKFLTRLEIESPVFEDNIVLGLSFVNLLQKQFEDKQIINIVNKFLEYESVIDSLSMVLMNADVAYIRGDRILVHNSKSKSRNGVLIPKNIYKKMNFVNIKIREK